jgi:DNA-binding response OmpR family regulator
MRILLIEDDQYLRDILKKVLSDELFVIDTSGDGDSGSYIARTNKYDLIILDYILPGKNADQILKEVRTAGIHTPVLIISIRGQIDEKIKLFDNGADDYLCKPFSPTELIMRVKALLRRPYTITPETYFLDDLTIDRSSQEVKVGGETIYLTKKEYMIIECMAQKCGQVVTRSHLIETVWDNETNPFSNTIEAHIRNVRKKIKRKYIHTVPGRGYKLDRCK